MRRRPDPRRPPGRPTATDSTAAATDRPTGSRTPTPRPPGDPRTKAYAARLTATGKNCKEILRCLKRAIAREAWHLLTHPQPAPRTDDLRRLRHERGLTLTQAAHHLNTHPARISELERGTRPDTTLTAAYRQWLNTQQPQTHTA